MTFPNLQRAGVKGNKFSVSALQMEFQCFVDYNLDFLQYTFPLPVYRHMNKVSINHRTSTFPTPIQFGLPFISTFDCRIDILVGKQNKVRIPLYCHYVVVGAVVNNEGSEINRQG